MPVKHYALDVDDVLVHISAPWAKLLRDHPGAAGLLRDMPATDEGLLRSALERRSYRIEQWLEAHGFDPAVLQGLAMELYRDNLAFYDALPPTAFCRAVLRGMELMRNVQVHLITHCFDLDEPATLSKRAWIERTFAAVRGRVVLHELTHNQMKSAWVAQHCPDAELFADDALRNVIDVLHNSSARPKQILIPRMGHNSALPPETSLLARLRGITVTHYDETA